MITVPSIKKNNKAKHEVLKQNTLASFPFLIKVSNEEFGEVCYVNYHENVNFYDDEYQAGFFEFTPPEQTDDGIKDASLRLSNIDQRWIKKIRETTGEIKVQFIAVIIYDTNGIECISPIENMDFYVSDVSWNDVTLDMTLVFDEKTNILVPCDIADSIKCAGCA